VAAGLGNFNYVLGKYKVRTPWRHVVPPAYHTSSHKDYHKDVFDDKQKFVPHTTRSGTMNRKMILWSGVCVRGKGGKGSLACHLNPLGKCGRYVDRVLGCLVLFPVRLALLQDLAAGPPGRGQQLILHYRSPWNSIWGQISGVLERRIEAIQQGGGVFKGGLGSRFPRRISLIAASTVCAGLIK